jgi:hypothetical protein
MNPKHTKKRKIPLISLILLSIALISAIFLFIARSNSAFADTINKYPGGFIRAGLAFLTNIIPFSLAEFFIILIPIAATFLIVYAIKHKSSRWRDVLVYLTSLFAAVSLIFTLFIFSFGIGYHVPTLYERFDIPKDGVDADSLRTTAVKLATEVNRRTDFIEYSDDGSSIMPYALSEMNDKLMESYKTTSGELGFLQNFKSKIKPVLLSVPMSYTHTTGIYTFFTGEANINVDFPDYTIPYTSAHELAHQRGISRENEANFIAFLSACGLENPKSEFLIPTEVGKMLADGVQVSVIPTSCQWFGMTFSEETPMVSQALAQMTREGLYPTPLFP